ncbi:uncharacterized protein LOC101847320 [Aplysia californica]|uniref:Uncharacterized protein LOC101847320 n=1 Tax=Aplysia californica TaxID=6500 RepID=A0ABM0JIM5_APLCA|nr:uncharacterized protein LOC101847320 [Aplysia californica]
MAILGILCATAGLVVAVIHVVLLVMKKHVTILQLVAGILNCCAFLFFLIAVIIWAADINDAFSTDTDLGYSFALGIVGELFSLAAGIIFIVGWVSGNNGVAP